MRGIGIAVITSTFRIAVGAFGLECQTLVHAEAMLLVNDGDCDVLKSNVGLKECVRTDQDVDLTLLKAS